MWGKEHGLGDDHRRDGDGEDKIEEGVEVTLYLVNLRDDIGLPTREVVGMHGGGSDDEAARANVRRAL